MNPFTLLPHRRGIGDQAICDWFDVVRLAETKDTKKPGLYVSTKRLMATWGVAACSVSRRLAAINRAHQALSALGDHQIGRIVRAHRYQGWWRVVLSSEKP